MLINPTVRSRGKKAASWLITLSMLLSLFPAVPAMAAGLWAATYDPDAFTGENLVIEIYDADNGIAEAIEWTDVIGERIADQTADELFGDGNSYYAVVQYQNYDAVMAEYRNYVITIADLESAWAELPDTSEDPMMESKSTYNGDYDAYVDAHVEQQTGNMTPIELQNFLDEVVRSGMYIPISDYSVMVQARTVALDGDDPALYIDADFFADCVPAQWVLPEENFTSTGGDDDILIGGDYSDIIGGDYSDIIGGDYSDLTGGDYSDLTGSAGGSLKLRLRDGGYFIPVLVKLLPAGAETEEEEYSAGNSYLMDKIGMYDMQSNDLVDGTVDTDYALYVAPGDYTMIYEDNSSGVNTLDWEDFTVTDDGGSVDFSGARDFISLTADMTGFLPEADTVMTLFFSAADGPTDLSIALGTDTVQCRACTFEDTNLTVSESLTEIPDFSGGTIDTANISMTTLVSSFALDPEILNTPGTVRAIDLGDLGATQWQGELTFTSDETGEAKAVYTAGEAMTGKLNIHNGGGFSLQYQFYMSGQSQDIMIFEQAPTEDMFNALYAIPSITVAYTGGDVLDSGATMFYPFSFRAPDSSRQVDAVYDFATSDGAVDISVTASEVINVGAASDTQPPAAPTGFSGELLDGTLNFSWSANTEEDLCGYILYRTDSDGEIKGEALAQAAADARSVSVAVDSVWGQGPWYFVLCAFDLTGNESEVCAPIAIQDPNADFYGEASVTVADGTLEDGVLTLDTGRAGELSIIYTADPSLPAASLPDALSAAVFYEDLDGEAHAASLELPGSGGLYSVDWSIPGDAAKLNKVSFLKNGAEIAAETLSCDIHAAITVTLPEYPVGEYFTGLRLSGAALEEKSGAYSGIVSRVGLNHASIAFLMDKTVYTCSELLGACATGEPDVFDIPLSAMPNLMAVIPDWDPVELYVSPSVQLLDGNGKALMTAHYAADSRGTPVLVRNSVNAAKIKLNLSSDSADLEIVSDDPICSGIDWQKGTVVSASGTVRIKDADRVLHMDIYSGADGDEPYDQSAVALTFRGSADYDLYHADWRPYLNQADVSHIPAGTYTVTAGHNCTPVQVTLTGAGEIEAPDLVQYDQIVFEFELTPTLAKNQPESIVEEQAEEGFTSDALHLLTDQLRVFCWDTNGIKQELPLSDYRSSYNGVTAIETQPVLLRDVDLNRALEVDTGGYVQLLLAGVIPYTQSWYYTDYRVAPLRDSILYTDDLSSTLSQEGLNKPVRVICTGSPELTLQASPTVQVNATRSVAETRAYFCFVSEDGSSRLEIADFAASRNGGKQVFRFDEMDPGTYDVLFYLSDTGRKMALEQQFLNSEDEFVPPADACAVGSRDVTFDDESNVLYLDTPDAPVDESEPGMHNLAITPDKGVVMDGDLLSFTVKFTYVPEDHPYVMELRPLNFSDGAFTVSVKKADGTAVPCSVNAEGELTLPNDQGVLTGTIIYAGTAYATPSTVGPGLTIYELATDSLGDQWHYVVRWAKFYSSLGAEIQTAEVPVNGRSDAEPFEIKIVSNSDESAASTTQVTPSRYGYWNAELSFPFTVDAGMEESFIVTYEREDGTVLLTQNVTGVARLPVLPAEIRYSYYMVDHAQGRYDYTFVGHREDNYKALRDANVSFGEDFGTTTLTLEVDFDDTVVNENGYTDAQLVTNPTVLVYAGRNLYSFDMTPANKEYYVSGGQQIPYATTYTVTYRDVYYGPFEICYDVLNPNGVSVSGIDNPALPTEGEQYEAIKRDWAQLTQDIYDAGGALVNNGPDTTFTYTVEDAVFEEISCADLAGEGLSDAVMDELEDMVFLSDEPRDLTVSMSNYTSVTAIDDIDAAIEALDAVEDEENPWLYYTREEGEDGVVAYIRYYNPRYAFVLSEEQPETLPGEEERVSLDLVVVQEYAKLYDFSALTDGAASTEAFARTNAPAPADKAISLFGLFDGLFDDGFGPPENWGPKPLTVMDVGDGSLSMKDFAKAVVPGTANAILETGEMVNKGIGIVDQAAEAVELLGLDPEELKAPEGTDQLLLGKKGAAALKVVDYAKKGYDAYNKLSQDENDPKKAKLQQVENDLKQVRDQAMQRCSCLLDEQGAEIQMQIQAQYQEGLIKIQELVTAIDMHEAVNDLIDIGQDVAPAKVNLYKAAADVSIDLTQTMADDIHDSQRWLEVNDTYRIYYNGISRLSFGCDPTKCDDIKEPKVEDNLARGESRYTGPIPSSPVGTISPSHVIDPSGVVYEGMLSNPLEGVTCTIQYKDEATGEWMDWEEAPGYNDQTTTILSNKSGYYRWDVPAGLWRVKYYMEGYNGSKAVYSGEMPVPPVWLDVNRNMLANDSTPTAAVSSEDGSILVTFDTPVQWSTVSSGASVTIDGKAAEGEWSILSGGEGDIYADGITFGENGLPADTPVTGQLVTKVRFTPAVRPTTGSSYAVALTGAVESYGGDAMEAATLSGTIVGGSAPSEPGGDTGDTGDTGGDTGDTGGFGGPAPSVKKTDTVTASPKGGSYTAFGGNVKLTVEGGSFTASTRITLTRSKGAGYGDTYDIVFAVQPRDTVKFTFRLDPDAAKAADPRKLGLWAKKDGSDEWTFAGGAYDPTDNTLTLLTRMDGKYEVRYNSYTFPDLPTEHWAFDFMDVMAARRIMQGNTLGQAEPDRTITRAEAAAMLVNVLQANSLIDRIPEVSDNFTDVDQDDWYYYPLNLAAKRGLIVGYADGSAGALDNITREQLAAMLARAVVSAEELAAVGQPDYKDADRISAWAIPFVAALQEKGLMVGDQNGSFNPQAKATRAEVAALMYRVMELYGLVWFDPEAPELPCLTCPYSR